VRELASYLFYINRVESRASNVLSAVSTLEIERDTCPGASAKEFGCFLQLCPDWLIEG